MIKLKNNVDDHYVKVDGRERIQNFHICIGKYIMLLMIPITTNMIISFALREPHNALSPPSMLKLQKIMPGSVKKGLRHHCRKCGGVVCTSCYSCKEKLKVYVDRDDSVKIWVDPSKNHSPPAFTVCKRCHTQVMEELRVTKAMSQKKPNVFCQLCGMPCMKKSNSQ